MTSTLPYENFQKLLVTRLFMGFVYGNMQRAGAVYNMTVKEAMNKKIVIKDERQFLKILVSRHKTASTYGPATLFLNAEDFQLFDFYYELRINETDNNSLPFFVINDSSLEKRYTQHMRDFAKFFQN